LCNEAASQAGGGFLLFLNNDVQPPADDWLAQMLRVGQDPRVGVVGATLLYPDQTLQHAGVFPLGNGEWQHAYRGAPANAEGDFGELRQVRAVPAVTGACLLVRRSRFWELGGFDERHAITLSDVALCQRAAEHGLLTAITPHARLVHFESLSRGYTRERPRA
jgi:GT2 family glycosyltransferase